MLPGVSVGILLGVSAGGADGTSAGAFPHPLKRKNSNAVKVITFLIFMAGSFSEKPGLVMPY
jgi:hypothetical protein